MNLKDKVTQHTGHFVCQQIGQPAQQKTVHFRHLATEPRPYSGPDLPGFKAFYAMFGSLTLYLDEASGEAGFYLAAPDEWAQLEDCFALWIEDLESDDPDLPAWLGQRQVVGEIPGSGNYLLVPTQGPEAGKVFEFEHDGFEFIERAADLCHFVESVLAPSPADLTAMASHLRFTTPASPAQWWITALHDKQGHSVRTRT